MESQNLKMLDASSDAEMSQPSLNSTLVDKDEDPQYATGFKLAAIVVCLLLAVFCVAIDNTSMLSHA